MKRLLLLVLLSWHPAIALPPSSPEDQGVNGTLLDELDRDFRNGIFADVDSFLVMRNGFLIYEKSYPRDYRSTPLKAPPGPYNYSDPDWHPWHGEGLHSLQSVTKSVTSALVGLAIGRGEIPSTQVPIASYFDHPDFHLDPGTTLADLLTMRSGIQWDEDSPYEDPNNDWRGLECSPDWLRYVLQKPQIDPPGSKFYYNSGVTILLAHILHQATGLQADEYARRYLFAPLGIERHDWKISPTGIPDTQGGLYLAPRDLAKIGQLYLQDGVWEGTRLLAPGWVQETVTPRAEDQGWKYGFHWWLLPLPDSQGDAYTCLGYGGQRLFVFPRQKLVAVFTGWNIHGKPYLPVDKALARLLRAVH